MIDENNNPLGENAEKVTDTSGENVFYDDVAIRSLKNGDSFDTSFFGAPFRISVAIYAVLALVILSLFLPFLSELPVTRVSTGGKYSADLGLYQNKAMSKIFWSKNYSANGFDVMLGKTVPYIEDDGNALFRIPLSKDISFGKDAIGMDLEVGLKATRYINTSLYLSYGSLWGVLIPILMIYAAILISSREQWVAGGGFLRAMICCIGALLIYFYMYIFTCGGLTKFFSFSDRAQMRTNMDVFRNLGIGFWIGIALTILAIVFCALAKIRIATGKKPYISTKNRNKYTELSGEVLAND